MKPGQTFPNELELAVLLAMFDPATDERWHPEKLHVLSRKFTGVGSYTEFSCKVGPDAKPSHRGPKRTFTTGGFGSIRVKSFGGARQSIIGTCCHRPRAIQ
jgi:hypothetical protein